jgi:hypothetical protein
MAAPPIPSLHPVTSNSSILYYWNPSTTTTEYVSSFNLLFTGPSITSNVALTSNYRFYAFTGLSTSCNYSASVYLTDTSNNVSPAVDYRTVITGNRPTAPTNVSASYLGSNRLLVQWSTPTSDGGAPIKNYAIKTPENSNIRIPARYNQFAINTPALSTGTYSFWVQAINDAGYGPKMFTSNFIIPFIGLRPAVYFNFENTCNDFYSNYTGTFNSGLTYSPSSIVGLSSIYLNGSNQYFNFTGPTINYSSFTFSGWCLYRGINTWERLFDFGISGGSKYCMLTPRAGGFNAIRLQYDDGNFYSMDAAIPVQSNVWSHLAVTLDGSRGRIYRNGIAVASNDSMPKSMYTIGSVSNWIGRSFYGDPYLTAEVDEIGLYSTALDASTIQLIYDNQVINGNSLNSISVYSTIVTSNLIQWYDPALKSCYMGYGNTLMNTGPNNTNLTLSGSYGYNGSNGLRLSNISATSNTNTSYVQANATVTSFRTISMWYRVESVPANAYLLDARTGVTGGDIVGNASAVTVGSYWSNATVYSNGGSGVNISSLQNSLLAVGGWRNYTFVATAAGSDTINFFSANNNVAGADVTFGSILIYDRALTQAENTQNYNRYKSRYGL